MTKLAGINLAPEGGFFVFGFRYALARICDLSAAGFICAFIYSLFLSWFCRTTQKEHIANGLPTDLLLVMPALALLVWPIFVGVYRLCGVRVSPLTERILYIVWLAAVALALLWAGTKVSAFQYASVEQRLAASHRVLRQPTDEDMRQIIERVQTFRSFELLLARLEGGFTVALLGLVVPPLGLALLRRNLTGKS